MAKLKTSDSTTNFSNLIYNCTFLQNAYYKSNNGRIIWKTLEEYLHNSIYVIKEKIVSRSTTKTKSRERKSKI